MVMQIIVELLFLNINENDVVSIASTIYECNLTKAERAANCRILILYSISEKISIDHIGALTCGCS